MSKKAYITFQMFMAVKTLLKGGASGKECAEYLNVAESTVSKIRRCETYDDYKNQTRAMWAKLANKEKPQETKEEPKEQPPVVEHKQTVVVQATHYMMEELRKQNELLTLISNKLAFIVDELTK